MDSLIHLGLRYVNSYLWTVSESNRGLKLAKLAFSQLALTAHLLILTHLLLYVNCFVLLSGLEPASPRYEGGGLPHTSTGAYSSDNDFLAS
jgi:hypothetical protein